MAEEKSQDQKICENMDKIGRKILIMSGKGGVGKTTVTVNLANALVAQGHSVGILDTDLHGPNVAKMLGCEGQQLLGDENGKIQPIETKNGIKVVSVSFALSDPNQAVVFRGPMKLSVIKQFLADVEWGSLEYLLIDSPPGTGDEQLAAAQSIPAITGCVLVTTPQDVAILDARKSISFANQLDLRIIGLVENMSYLICPDCGKEIAVFGKDGGKKLAQEASVPLLARIPMELDLVADEDNGVNWIEKCNSKSAEEFKNMAAYIHSATKPSCSADVGYVPQSASCSPESCATCSLDCPSKKK